MLISQRRWQPTPACFARVAGSLGDGKPNCFCSRGLDGGMRRAAGNDNLAIRHYVVQAAFDVGKQMLQGNVFARGRTRRQRQRRGCSQRLPTGNRRQGRQNMIMHETVQALALRDARPFALGVC